jgi:hypothetical protein
MPRPGRTSLAGSSQALAAVAVAALAGLPFTLPGLGAPDRDNIQQAYDAAKVESGVKHQDDLKIRTAQCSAIPDHRYACQIDFVRTAEPHGRLYFTVVTVEKRADAWILIGGLCKTIG